MALVIPSPLAHRRSLVGASRIGAVPVTGENAVARQLCACKRAVRAGVWISEHHTRMSRVSNTRVHDEPGST